MDLLVTLGDWTARPGPLRARLAAALESAIERGDLPPETRLPPERSLARQLHLSRNTVVSAYDTLRDDGLLHRRQGSGTYVAGRSSLGRSDDPHGIVQSSYLARRDRGSAGLDAHVGDSRLIDLSRIAPSTCDRIPPRVFELAAGELHVATGTDGHLPYGVPCIREAIAARLTAARLPTSPDEIFVTTGAQQGITLVTQLLVRPGDRVVVESPTYPGTIDALRQADAFLTPLAVDGEGGNVDALPALLDRTAARALYVCSTFQSPTGTLLSDRRRRDLARIAEQRPLAVVDDVALADTSLGVGVPPLLASYAPDASVFTIGSLSKILWAGLRVGWVRASPPVIERLARLKVVADHGSSVVSQIVAARLLQDVDDSIELRRRESIERVDRLGSLLRAALPEWAFERPAGGLLLWVRLPRGDGAEFAHLALRRGVVVVPGSVAIPEGAPSCYLRIPFGLEPEVAQEGVRRLAMAWAEYEPSARNRDGVRVID